ncbi:AzlD family protein [Swingsia samuiensis]|uniref:AzlD family protein n=2 Tax=Swingsia samuiensis TaxID=1293412 RepID=A0A4Y6UPR4_9PROT|nr:AzlD family protein [Swingsia samuiensis]
MHWISVLTILGMALITYLTRLLGYLFLRGKNLSERTIFFMDILPGCVLISVIAPAFSSGKIPDYIGLIVTIAAAMRFSLLPTMFLGVGSTGLLRYLLTS